LEYVSGRVLGGDRASCVWVAALVYIRDGRRTWRVPCKNGGVDRLLAWGWAGREVVPRLLFLECALQDGSEISERARWREGGRDDGRVNRLARKKRLQEGKERPE
jgi:hypothetical protein